MAENQKVPRSASAGFVISAAACAAALLSGFGSRWGLWNFIIGFLILLAAIPAGAAAVITCVVGLSASVKRMSKKGAAAAVSGIIIGIITVAIPVSVIMQAMPLPAINDITTDTVSPPEFSAVLSLRQNAPVPAQYPGIAAAQKQAAAYPDIKPIVLSIPAESAFDKALAICVKMNWKVDDSNVKEGRIEATDTTTWFGFKDDIVIRITRQVPGCRVDIRSVSRVGKGDAGTNAARIRKFIKIMGS